MTTENSEFSFFSISFVVLRSSCGDILVCRRPQNISEISSDFIFIYFLLHTLNSQSTRCLLDKQINFFVLTILTTIKLTFDRLLRDNLFSLCFWLSLEVKFTIQFIELLVFLRLLSDSKLTFLATNARRACDCINFLCILKFKWTHFAASP